MYKSKEIRWFTDRESKYITSWFSEQKLDFASAEPRTDFYLPLPQDDLSVKLREGRIEFKKRTGTLAHHNLTATANGLFEEWVKWSFLVDKSDLLAHEITYERKFDWIETIKTRIGLIITLDRMNKPGLVPIHTYVPFGCQVEYTEIIVDQKTYYSFALEWFGAKHIEVNPGFMSEILGNTVLEEECSMSYAEFLLKTAKSFNK